MMYHDEAFLWNIHATLNCKTKVFSAGNYVLLSNTAEVLSEIISFLEEVDVKIVSKNNNNNCSLIDEKNVVNNSKNNNEKMSDIINELKLKLNDQ